jgi:hypothetical protein
MQLGRGSFEPKVRIDRGTHESSTRSYGKRFQESIEMSTRYKRRFSKASPGLILIGVVLAAAAVTTAVILLVRGGGNKVEADSVQPYAARVERVDGTVNIARIDDANTDQPEWISAAVNTPVTAGNRIYLDDGSRASIALSAHDYVRLNEGSTLDVLTIEDLRTQLALRGGSGLFEVGDLAEGELYEVATPFGAIDCAKPGLYQIGIEDNSAIVSVLSGLARVVGASGSGEIAQGQVLTLTGEEAAAVSSSLSPGLAGGIVDDYYRYRHAKVYDGRYANYATYVQDPYYYDRYVSSQYSDYCPTDVPGVYELADYGDWQYINDYGGYCWAPRVASDWAPFRYGHWDLTSVWGPTWIASESWGWAPYHYGRWAYTSNRWFWVPARVVTRRNYCPAPVAFLPLTQVSQIAWVPLGPGELYVSRYYDAGWQPRYLASRDVINVVTVQRTFVNLNTPDGVTCVPFGALGRRIDRNVLVRLDSGTIAAVAPAIDPFAVDGFRRVALEDREARRRFKQARFERALDRPVVTSVAPVSLPDRADFGKAFGVQAVGDKQKRNQLKIDRTQEVVDRRRPDGLPVPSTLQSRATNSAGDAERAQRIAELSARAEKGDRAARREMKQLVREERAARQQAAPGQPRQAQPAGQPQGARQQNNDELRRQMKQERKRRGQEQTQPQAQGQAQQNDARRQMKQQQRQQQAAGAQQQTQQNDARRQMKQQRRQQQAAGAQQAQRQAQQNEASRQMKQQQRQQRQARPNVSPSPPRPPKRKPPQAFMQPVPRQPQMTGRPSVQFESQRRAATRTMSVPQPRPEKRRVEAVNPRATERFQRMRSQASRPAFKQQGPARQVQPMQQPRQMSQPMMQPGRVQKQAAPAGQQRAEKAKRRGQ